MTEPKVESPTPSSDPDVVRAWAIEYCLLRNNPNWSVDKNLGVFLDREIAEEVVSGLNDADRARQNKDLDDDYQTAMAAYQGIEREHHALVEAGLRTGPVRVARPERRRLLFTEKWRVSEPLTVHRTRRGKRTRSSSAATGQ